MYHVIRISSERSSLEEVSKEAKTTCVDYRIDSGQRFACIFFLIILLQVNKSLRAFFMNNSCIDLKKALKLFVLMRELCVIIIIIP